MKAKYFAILSLVLWVITAGVILRMFIMGSTIKDQDGRQAILLKPAERNLILKEMRGMLGSVKGIVSAMRTEDSKAIAEAARKSGMSAAVDVTPELFRKLPIEFKGRGMNLHKNFDALADEAEKGASRERILELLDQQLSSCVACHSTYRLVPEGEASRGH
ncbi:MAG: hypothetical protein P8Z74_02155 [Acidobacteriota bacterium]